MQVGGLGISIKNSPVSYTYNKMNLLIITWLMKGIIIFALITTLKQEMRVAID